jgi:hypothetical protein
MTHCEPKTVDLSNPKWFNEPAMVLCMTKPKHVREIFAANLRTLMGDPNDPRRVRQSFLSKSGSNATIGRMLAGAGPNGPTLAKLEKVATRFNLQAWQLLIEGLDPSNPPRLERGSDAVVEEFHRRVAKLAEELGIERRRDH